MLLSWLLQLPQLYLQVTCLLHFLLPPRRHGVRSGKMGQGMRAAALLLSAMLAVVSAAQELGEGAATVPPEVRGPGGVVRGDSREDWKGLDVLGQICTAVPASCTPAGHEPEPQHSPPPRPYPHPFHPFHCSDACLAVRWAAIRRSGVRFSLQLWCPPSSRGSTPSLPSQRRL